VWTKAISTGTVLALFLAATGWFGAVPAAGAAVEGLAVVAGLVFLGLTGLLLIKDLDQPLRFAYVLLRPQWNSWLVRGGYLITFFGAALTLWGAGLLLEVEGLRQAGRWLSLPLAFGTAIYTAFLFGQAKGRDFWQSPVLALHMLIHAVMAGAAVLAAAGFVAPALADWAGPAARVLVAAIAANLLVTAAELVSTHANTASAAAARMITAGRFRGAFWGGMILAGNVVPALALVALAAFHPENVWMPVSAVLVLAGLWITERLWVEAPQRLPLS
jgi:formate-dependent nitrite reductase membrane component NrfD